MDNIKDIVHKVFEDISSKKPSAHQLIEQAWKETLKEQELEHTRLDGIKEGMLSVCVDSSAWLYEMKTKKAAILKKMKTQCPDVKDIMFRIGKM